MPQRKLGTDYPKIILERAQALKEFFEKTGNKIELAEYDDRSVKFLPHQYFLYPLENLSVARQAVSKILTNFTRRNFLLKPIPDPQDDKDIDDAFNHVVTKYSSPLARHLSLLTPKEIYEEVPVEARANIRNRPLHFSTKDCTNYLDNLMPLAIAKGIVLEVRRNLGEGRFDATTDDPKKLMQEITKSLNEQIKQFIAERGTEVLTPEFVATAVGNISRQILPQKDGFLLFSKKDFCLTSLGLLEKAIAISFPTAKPALKLSSAAPKRVVAKRKVLPADSAEQFDDLAAKISDSPQAGAGSSDIVDNGAGTALNTAPQGDGLTVTDCSTVVNSPAKVRGG